VHPLPWVDDTGETPDNADLDPLPVVMDRRPGMHRSHTTRRQPQIVIASMTIAAIVAITLATMLAVSLLGNGTAKTAGSQPGATSRILGSFTGTGSGRTPAFTAGGAGTWELIWSYDCANASHPGTFAVTEAPPNPRAVTVNATGDSGHGSTYAYADTGIHYLRITSTCAWKTRVKGQP